MAIAQVVAGARILISDLNAYYSLLKGSAGEAVTLIYNAAGSVIFQPSSDPTATTQLVQIKNNAGTVKSALTSGGGLVLSNPALFAQSSDIASSGTTDLSTATGNYAVVTGTTTITAFGTVQAGTVMVLKFSGALTLTHNATSLIMRSAANATTVAGDIYAFVSEGSGNWRELWHLTSLTSTGEPNRVSTYRVTDDFGIGQGSVGTGGNVAAQFGLSWFQISIGVVETAVFISGVANHPGIVELDTSATASRAIELFSNGNAGWLLPTDTFDSTWIIRPNSTVDANMVFRFGLTDSNSAPATGMTAPTNGIYIEKLTGDTQYFGVCRNGGTQTRTAAFATVTNGTWVKFRIRRVDASTIGFTQDANTEVTVTTNIPSAVMFSHIAIGNNASANSRKLDIDLYDMQVTGITR